MNPVSSCAGKGVWGAADLAASPDFDWIKSASGSLGFVSFPGSACFSLADRSPILQLPHLSIAADVQLHNREELVHLLSLGEPLSRFGDSRLLLAAYEKWGEDCGRFLLGEFAFAIWDDRRRQLFCCRDQMGVRPFLYWSRGSRFVFASDVESILHTPGVPRELNRRKLAGMAIFDGQQFYPDETFHTGVMSLPAGSSLTVGRSGIRKREYWVPTIRPDLVPRKPAEAFEALRHLLFQAVDCRMPEGSPLAVELSGGLDSSAVAAIAARSLEKKGRSLIALAGVLPDDQLQKHRDEREFIDEFRSWPNIRIEYVSAPGRGPFDWIETPERYFATPVRTSRFYLHDAFNEKAISNGAQTVMRGIKGELGPTCFAQRYFVELAVKLRWPTLFRELQGLKRLRGMHPIRYLGGQFIDLLRPLPWQRYNPQVLFTKDFERNGKAWKSPRCAWPDQRRQQLADLQRFLGQHASWWGRSIEEPVRISQPWLDRRVIEFCLAAPPELKVRNGYQRNLIRRALEGVLPKKIQWRTTKAPFSPDYYVRYNRQLGKALEFVGAIRANDPIRQVVDVDRLVGLMRPVDPQAVSVAARDVVPATFYVLCFLRQFADYRLG